MARSRNAGLFVAAALCVTACGDDFLTPDDGGGGASAGGAGGLASGGGGAGGESFEEFSAACQTRAETSCESFFTCNPILATWVLNDEATCVAVRTEECEELYGKGTGLTAEAMLSCEAAVPAEPSCDGTVLDACVITGTEPDGTGCFSNYECQSGWCSPSTASAACGVCSAFLGPGKGGPGDEGDPCEQWTDCAADLTCYAGSCQPHGEEGDACEPQPFGSPDTCLDGLLRCNPLSLLCEAPAAPSPVGGECGYDGSGHFRLCEGGACALGSAPDDLSMPGVCVPYRQEGDPCGATLFDSYYGHTGYDCAPGLLCVSGGGDLVIIGTGTCQSTPWRDCSE